MFSVLRRAAKCRIFVVVGFLKLCGEKKKVSSFRTAVLKCSVVLMSEQSPRKPEGNPGQRAEDSACMGVLL